MENIIGKADLHIHSTYSKDGTATIQEILAYTRDHTNLDVIAITDHDEIAGAVEAAQLADQYGIDVIIGEEITTRDGHLLALFINNKIQPGLSMQDTIDLIAIQGGICIPAHPTNQEAPSLSAASFQKLLKNPSNRKVLVGLEAFNACIFEKESNLTAEILAFSSGLSPVGNSDSHIKETIGFGATCFHGKKANDLREALILGKTKILKNKVKPINILVKWIPRYIFKRLKEFFQNRKKPQPKPFFEHPISNLAKN